MSSRPRTSFVCQSCGNRTPKWVGRCGACDEWGTVVEETAATTTADPKADARAAFGALVATAPKRLLDIDGTEVPRRGTGIGELDRVLGGGLVPGSLMLVGGDPGIGKSTLMLQASERLAASGLRVLYVTGEESPHQTRMRFDRIGARAADLWLVAETSLQRIEAHVEALKPQVLVADSVQTLYTEDLSSAPGSVGQLREVTARLLALAKGRAIATFLVGHVTKDGAIAGPRVLEHMVDTVLYLEGQRGHAFRILRAVKNRFGSTNEIGTFEMRAEGLDEVKNPSALFLAERVTGAAGSVVAASYEGTRPVLVEVQALVAPTPLGTPRRTAIGADTARLALLLAVLEKKAGLFFSGCDVFVNVAGGLKLDEPAVDLALVMALASSLRDRAPDSSTVVFGEVGLAGEVRGVVGADARVAEAHQLGFTRAVVPARNLDRLERRPGIELVGASTVAEALDLMGLG
jgi:DNA repair protein RadA/Sms